MLAHARRVLSHAHAGAVRQWMGAEVEWSCAVVKDYHHPGRMPPWLFTSCHHKG